MLEIFKPTFTSLILRVMKEIISGISLMSFFFFKSEDHKIPSERRVSTELLVFPIVIKYFSKAKVLYS